MKPETVIKWHRQGFKCYWREQSRSRRVGRSRIDQEIRDLIRKMSRENRTWGVPRIQAELHLFGYEVAESTVAKYRVRICKPPSQTWKSFLQNHAGQIVAIDFFTVPTVTFNLLRDRDRIYGDYFRQRVRGLGLKEVLSAPPSPWQNPYVERLIGSIRRECLDHVIVLNEHHLRRVLQRYFGYYHRTRMHLSVNKDAPDTRPGRLPAMGTVVEIAEVGGLHHRYERRAA